MQKKVWVIGTGADGPPAVQSFVFEVTEKQYELGIHFAKASQECTLERPYVCVDETEIASVMKGLTS